MLIFAASIDLILRFLESIPETAAPIQRPRPHSGLASPPFESFLGGGSAVTNPCSHVLSQCWTSERLYLRWGFCSTCRFDLYSISSSSSSLRAPGLLLLFLDFPPRAGAPREWLLLLLLLVGGGRTKAKSTEMVWSSNFVSFTPSTAAFASSSVGNSIRT
jgi:hypothetical protein